MWCQSVSLNLVKKIVCKLFFAAAFLASSVWAVTDARVTLESSPHDIHNQASILRGGEHFKSNCISCHSLRLARNNKVLQLLGITQEMMPEWPGDSWGGHPPPDLSLMAEQMGTDWIYTYLRNYYPDSSRPYGVNNRVYQNVNMPHVLEDLQNSLPKAEYDLLIYDLTNFMTYVADPTAEQRKRIGIYVLLFLTIFTAFAYLTYKEFKKDLK